MVTSKRFHGIKKAPNHVPISAGHMQAVQRVSRVLEVINKVAVPDVKNGTTRNTITTVVTIAGSWIGDIGGAMIGATIGTYFLPGMRTLIGGLVGGIVGGVGGYFGADAVVNAVADAANYNVEYPSNRRSTAVSIVDNAAKTVKGKPKAWIRYDRPHPGADFNHINVDRVTSKRYYGS
uniref:Gly-zipper_Omp domain-containing protein n=1 Tax=Panagrellus redivivus TaxID=6233 RepID=A0A7E4VV03_PANRE